jgi:hypothetical protein
LITMRDFHQFGWLFFVFMAVLLIGIGIAWGLTRRKRAAAERRAAWQAHRKWQEESAPQPPLKHSAPHASPPR